MKLQGEEVLTRSFLSKNGGKGECLQGTRYLQEKKAVCLRLRKGGTRRGLERDLSFVHST